MRDNQLIYQSRDPWPDLPILFPIVANITNEGKEIALQLPGAFENMHITVGQNDLNKMWYFQLGLTGYKLAKGTANTTYCRIPCADIPELKFKDFAVTSWSSKRVGSRILIGKLLDNMAIKQDRSLSALIKMQERKDELKAARSETPHYQPRTQLSLPKIDQPQQQKEENMIDKDGYFTAEIRAENSNTLSITLPGGYSGRCFTIARNDEGYYLKEGDEGVTLPPVTSSGLTHGTFGVWRKLKIRLNASKKTRVRTAFSNGMISLGLCIDELIDQPATVSSRQSTGARGEKQAEETFVRSEPENKHDLLKQSLAYINDAVKDGGFKASIKEDGTVGLTYNVTL